MDVTRSTSDSFSGNHNLMIDEKYEYILKVFKIAWFFQIFIIINESLEKAFVHVQQYLTTSFYSNAI